MGLVKQIKKKWAKIYHSKEAQKLAEKAGLFHLDKNGKLIFGRRRKD